MRPLSLALASLVLCACGTPSDDLAPTRAALNAITGTCSAKSGDVQFKRKGEGFWSDAAVASVLRPGDWVRTGKGASARIEILSGGALELEENATLVLEENALDAAAPLISLQSGAATGTLSKSNGGAITLKLADGSSAELSADGEAAEFVLTTADGGTDLELSRGAASLLAGEERHALELGVVASFTAEGIKQVPLLPPPGSLSPAPEALTSAALDVSLGWLPVSGARSYRVQVARDAEFSSEPVTFEAETHAATFTPNGPGAYYWRVATVDERKRAGRWSMVRRFFAVNGSPEDALQKPLDRAVYAFVDSAPRLNLSWRGERDGRYLVVLASGPDLLHDRVKTLSVDSVSAQVEELAQGQYFWGVYREEDGIPLFTRPRKLTLKKNAKAVLKAPKRINKWGKQ